MSVMLTLIASSAAAVQEAGQQREEQICQARADEQKIAANLRNTYIRECLAGERLNRSEAPVK
jgi:hypothetical protein